jgi:hypothetical protein
VYWNGEERRYVVQGGDWYMDQGLKDLNRVKMEIENEKRKKKERREQKLTTWEKKKRHFFHSV